MPYFEYGMQAGRVAAMDEERTAPPRARDRLVAEAALAFGALGYEAASLDEIVARAGVTKGSLYHHFGSKRDLFEAVYRRELARQVRLFNAAYGAVRGDPWGAFKAGCRCYLDVIADAAARRIAIVDAPAVLGAAKVRAIEDAEVVGDLRAGVTAAMEAGQIARRPVGPVANLVFAALCEAATQLDRAESVTDAHREWAEELERFFEGLR